MWVKTRPSKWNQSKLCNLAVASDVIVTLGESGSDTQKYLKAAFPGDPGDYTTLGIYPDQAAADANLAIIWAAIQSGLPWLDLTQPTVDVEPVDDGPMDPRD